MTRLLLELSYVGTAFSGFQVQPESRTVQGTLCDAVKALYGVYCPVTGCSRTDSGVHANRFFCTVDIGEDANDIPLASVIKALNHYLPQDIAVKSVREVGDGFHARYSVKSKEYLYLIYNGESRNPFFNDRAFYYPKKLDINRMNEASKSYIGLHDFTAFCSSGSSVEDKHRTVYSASVVGNGDIVEFRVCGNGFLYNMVRIMTGTLIGVSDGRFSPEDIPEIIDSRDRSKAGFTAPACGLYLNDVIYN